PVDDRVRVPVAEGHQCVPDAVRRRRIPDPEGLALAILAAGQRVRKVDETPERGHRFLLGNGWREQQVERSFRTIESAPRTFKRNAWCTRKKKIDARVQLAASAHPAAKPTKM